MRLTSNIFDEYYLETGELLFGVQTGKILNHWDRVQKNGYWYDKHGMKVGWGDLSGRDLIRINREIDTKELFIVVPESSIFFPHDSGKIDEDSPGEDFVSKNCVYIVGKGFIYFVDRNRSHGRIFTASDGTAFECLLPDDKKILGLMHGV